MSCGVPNTVVIVSNTPADVTGHLLSQSHKWFAHSISCLPGATSPRFSALISAARFVAFVQLYVLSHHVGLNA